MNEVDTRASGSSCGDGGGGSDEERDKEKKWEIRKLRGRCSGGEGDSLS